MPGLILSENDVKQRLPDAKNTGILVSQVVKVFECHGYVDSASRAGR
jgi:hypothetical protein